MSQVIRKPGLLLTNVATLLFASRPVLLHRSAIE